LQVTPPTEPSGDCDRLMQAARRHADRGRFDEADQGCRKVMAIAKLDPRPYYLLAQLAQERGDAAKARALLASVIYLDPNCIAAYLDLAALHAADDAGRARKMYEAARAAAQKFPVQAQVGPGGSSAAEVIAFVDRELAGTADAAAGRHAALQSPPGG
jgi:chemotaxis protein methyltransferase CheR